MQSYLARCARLQSIMAEQSVDCFLASPSSDMLYLSGCPLKPGSRMAVLAVPQGGDPVFIVPTLEAPNLAGLGSAFDVRPWADPQDPVVLLKDIIGERGNLTFAISDQLWTTYLLQIQGRFPEARFIPGSKLLHEMRIIKAPEELDLLAKVSAMADRVFQKVTSLKIEGLTEAQLETQLGILMLEEGLESLDFRIIASGENGAAPHHFSGDRRIRWGDPVVMDFGGTYRGYYSDTTRTVCAGDASTEFRTVYEVVRRAQEAGIEAAQPGVPASAVDFAARSIIEEAGYGNYFIHGTGHGIGLDIHEDPPVNKNSSTVLEPGMAFTVEPGVYLPGRFGVRIEDVVVMTPQGAKRLNQSTKELITFHGTSAQSFGSR